MHRPHLTRGALALATIALLQACSEGEVTPVDEDVAEDVSPVDDVTQPADVSERDATVDTIAPSDTSTNDGSTVDVVTSDVVTSDVIATDVIAADVISTDASTDVVSTDVIATDARIDVVSPDAAIDVTIDATVDVAIDAAPVDARPADVATDTVTDVTTDSGTPSATGFRAAGSWPVPASGLSDGFFVSTAASGTQWWTLLDIDGDRLPDLVQTGDPARSGGYVFGAGTATPYWKVFRNTGTGFALTATSWSLPNIGLSDGPYTTFSASGTRWWATIDVDGDNRPDLVQTGDPARTGGYVFGAGTATPYWKVFRNTGTGFAATATYWSTPDIGLSDGPYSTTMATGTRWWSTFDIDGDNRPDLVQTGDPARTGGYVFGAGTATPYWKVFRNTGSGFAATATNWSTPNIGLGDGPYTTFAATGTRWWSTMDLDGDHRPDLVQTGDPARTGGYVFAAGTATAHWRVFRNTATGFAASGTDWSTPDIGLSDGPYVTSFASGTRWWSTIDVNGDSLPDLVQTGDPARTGGYVFGAGTASPYWKVFRNSGAGFASTASNWSTPDIGLSDGPYTTFAAAGTRWWITVDMNNDGRVDLAQTGDPARSGGYVFAGTGGAPASWRVFFGN